jgi:hypothetical protein
MLLQSVECDPAQKKLEEFISTRIGEFWRNVFGWKPGMDEPSFEDHFTQIDLAANTGHYLGRLHDPKKLRAIRRLTIHRVFTLLKSQGNQADHVIDFFRCATGALDMTVVTTNWDTEAEDCLTMLGKSVNYGLDEMNISGRQAPRGEIPVLKLHGCINQGYCDCCRDNIRFEGIGEATVRLALLLDEEDFRLFPDSENLAEYLKEARKGNRMYSAARLCPECGVRVGLRVGTFSFRKDLNPHAFYTIWDKARSSLRAAQKWLFVGYSLPEADVEIRQLLKSAQLARKDLSSLQIEVVLKEDRTRCPVEKMRYKRFFGLDDQQIYENGFESWIAERMTGYCS